MNNLRLYILYLLIREGILYPKNLKGLLKPFCIQYQTLRKNRSNKMNVSQFNSPRIYFIFALKYFKQNNAGTHVKRIILFNSQY